MTGHIPAQNITFDILEIWKRLTEAARVVFAEKGFLATTVREICRRAEANVAAINYHFGDKESLYIKANRSFQQSVTSHEHFDVNRRAIMTHIPSLTY